MEFIWFGGFREVSGFDTNVTSTCWILSLTDRSVWERHRKAQRPLRGTGFRDWPWTDDGGIWLWALWCGWSEGEPGGGLSENCRRHSAPAYRRLTKGRRTVRPANLPEPWAWNGSPAVQRHAHPGRSRPREVRLILGEINGEWDNF